MRVLVLTSSFPRFQGDSSGVFIYHLCKELQTLGVEIVVVAPHDYGCKRHELWEGIEIFRFPYFYPLKFQKLCYGAGILKNMKESPLPFLQLPFFILSEICCAFRVARRSRFDLVHAHWSLPQGLTGLLLREVFGIPCVTSLHGSDVYGLNFPFLRVLNSKVILGSDACTANSRPTAETAMRITGRNDIQVIPMGVDTEFFRKRHLQGTVHEHPGKEDRIVLYAGRLIDLKGVDYLIKAFALVLEKQSNAKLVIVGSGPGKGDLVNLSESLHLQGKALFLDAVSQEELARHYSSAHVFVLPSIINDKGETEGLGVVLLEAMACGVPVIGSAVGGIPDIIKDGETGLLALERNPGDLAERILRLWADEDLRKRLTEKGRHLVKERFSWEVIARKYAGLYDNVSCSV